MSKRVQISLEDKYRSIRQIESKKSTQIEISKQLKVSKATVSGWIADKEKIKTQFEVSNSKIAHRRGNHARYQYRTL